MAVSLVVVLVQAVYLRELNSRNKALSVRNASPVKVVGTTGMVLLKDDTYRYRSSLYNFQFSFAKDFKSEIHENGIKFGTKTTNYVPENDTSDGVGWAMAAESFGTLRNVPGPVAGPPERVVINNKSFMKETFKSPASAKTSLSYVTYTFYDTTTAYRIQFEAATANKQLWQKFDDAVKTFEITRSR